MEPPNLGARGRLPLCPLATPLGLALVSCSLGKEFIVCDLINILFGIYKKIMNFLTENLNEPIYGDLLYNKCKQNLILKFTISEF